MKYIFALPIAFICAQIADKILGFFVKFLDFLYTPIFEYIERLPGLAGGLLFVSIVMYIDSANKNTFATISFLIAWLFCIVAYIYSYDYAYPFLSGVIVKTANTFIKSDEKK